MSGRRVVAIGSPGAAYRLTFLAKVLRANDIDLALISRNAKKSTQYGNAFSRLMRRIGTKFYYRAPHWIRAFKAARSADAIYLLPLNGNEFLLSWSISRLYRIPLIAELYASAYASALDRSKSPTYTTLSENAFETFRTRPPFLVRLRLERFRRRDLGLLEHSDLVVHLSHVEATHITDLVGADTSKIRFEIVPLASPRRTHASARPASSEFSLCWWGSFIPLHGLGAILSAVSILRRREEDVRLNILGVREIPDSYADLIRSLELDDIVLVHSDKRFADGSLEKFLAANCDLALGIFGSSLKAYYTLPNKVVEALSMGLPTLSMDSPGVREFIDPANEIFCSTNIPHFIANSISEIMADEAERRRRAALGRERWTETFSFASYESAMQPVVGFINSAPHQMD